MAKIRQQDKRPLRLKQLGKVYRLIEQFDEISRIDLSKLSRLAPATITSLTRELIHEKLIIERAVQNTENRGRPAIGLCVSPFYWQSLCATLTEERFEILLSELNGKQILHKTYPLTALDLTQLDVVLVDYVKQFLSSAKGHLQHLITFSVAVGGKLNYQQSRLIQLGKTPLNLDIKALFAPHFQVPILVTEYFKTWILAESTLGSVIGCDNVLFLQLDDIVNLSVLCKGELLSYQDQVSLNIDKMVVPRFSSLQDLIGSELPQVERYQLSNQVTHQAIYQLIDSLYPEQQFNCAAEKVRFFFQQIQQNELRAISIIHHIADCVAYILMNLVHIFSSEKIMLSASLLVVKDPFLTRLNEKLAENLADHDAKVEVIIGKYKWNSPVVAAAAIKQGIYDGSLLDLLIKP